MPQPERNRLQTLLRTMSDNQLRYISARVHCHCDSEAAGICGISKDTVYHWGNKEAIDECVRLIVLEGISAATEILQRHTTDAALYFAAVLNDESAEKRLRLEAAKEILSRSGVSAASKLELSGDPDKPPLIREIIIERKSNPPSGNPALTNS